MPKNKVSTLRLSSFLKGFFINLFLLTCLIASGENYYVKNGGNDSNSGHSDTKAWAHHPWMSTWTGNITLKAGDTVFMKRNNSWTIATPSAEFMQVKQSGKNGKHIVTTWYGNFGAKPLIQITGNYPYPVIQGIGESFITFDHLEIRHYSSKRSEFSDQIGIVFGKDGSGNISHNWIITNCDIHDIPDTGINGSGDSYNIVIGDTSATSCATPTVFSNHIYECGYAGILMGGHNPGTGKSNWKIYHNYINKIDYHSAVQQDSYGIAFSSALASSGWPNYCYARFNRIEDVINWHGLDAHGGSNIYFEDNYIYNCRGAIIAFAADRKGLATPVLTHCYIERNTIENSGNHPTKYFFCIFLGAENKLHRASDCHVIGNSLFYSLRPSHEGASYGIYLEAVDGILIEKNKIYNGPTGTCSGAIHIGSKDFPARNVTVRKNFIHNWSWAINLDPGGIDGDVNIHQNIIYSNNRSVGSSTSDAFAGDINILNNTILMASNASAPYLLYFRNNTLPRGRSLIIKNNIIGFTSRSYLGKYLVAPGSISGMLNINYNLYWNCKNIYPFYFEGICSWLRWNRAGYDINGVINRDPGFKNSSNKYLLDFDFDLQSTSPAINRGTSLNFAADFVGRPISGIPDLGAFEFH
jgi:hypothetical protein